MSASDHLVTTIEQLEALYGEKAADRGGQGDRSHQRRLPRADRGVAVRCARDQRPGRARLLAASGDPKGFVRVLDEKTIAIPDRRGNNRIDSLRNIVRDPRIALLFLIPGVSETLRVIGRATHFGRSGAVQSFAMNGKPPRSVLVVPIETVFFHCAKAIVRSKLWDQATKIDRKSLPSTGSIIAEISEGKLGGEEYDRELPERHKAQLY